MESIPLDYEAFSSVVQELATYFVPGDTVLLQGGLGAGKTTFVQQAAQSLGVGKEQYVSSPSYGLLHEYKGKYTVYHMDLYRLVDEEDVEAAGLFDYFTHSGVSFVEWPERLKNALPPEYLWITISPVGANIRQLRLELHGESWQKRAEVFSRLLAPC